MADNQSFSACGTSRNALKMMCGIVLGLAELCKQIGQTLIAVRCGV